MGYYIDLSLISIEDYKAILKTTHLLPSRQILKDNIDANLDCIKAQNINNLEELQKTLKTKKVLEQFSAKSGLQKDYLAVLRRVINGYTPKPNRIKDFPNISEKVATTLEEVGIKNTLQLYPEILTPKKRSALATKTKLSKEEITKLTHLTDLSRVRWVNHTFAYVLYEAGYTTAQQMAGANAKELYETIKQLNKERKIYNAHIGENDMHLCITAAQTLDFEIEY